MASSTVRYGIAQALEDEANRLIVESLRGVTKHIDKSDILTAGKEASRKRREVFVASGTPDPAIRSGQYSRALNLTRPHLNSRNGVAPPHNGVGPANGPALSSFVEGLFDQGRRD